MALPYGGYRSVLSLMLEMSFALVEPIIFTGLTAAVTSGNAQTASVGSLGYPVPAVYLGAQLVIDFGNPNQEIITVTGVSTTSTPPTITANFIFSHATGAQIVGATFPTQAISGDYFFSQSEIIGYISRAQNEFLAQCPCILNLNTQFVQPGQIYQQLVCDAIEMERVASSTLAVPIVTLSRAGGVVTATTESPHGLAINQKFAIFNSPDPSFVGGFKVTAAPSSTQFTYAQIQPDATITSDPSGFAGNVGLVVLWQRLYETSQMELSIRDPNWKSQNVTQLRSWFEDRTGNYRFGVDGKPATTFPLEVLASVRDGNVLGMTDGFLVPDPFLTYIKYKALEYSWSKDGEQRSPLLEKYCAMRFDRGVIAVQRWMTGMGIKTGTGTGIGMEVGAV